jgi:CubicO group peptidase (beta-lactamase class C family)
MLDLERWRTSGRRRWRRELLALSVLLAACAPPLAAQAVLPVDVDRVVAELEPEIHRAMAEGRIPSLTIALVWGDEVLWARGYGSSNLYTRAPATPSTVYIVASTFKTMATAVLLQLVEEGKVGLDDPVGNYLGELTIPGEDPAAPITFRHLLTHTSGLPAAFTATPLWADTVPTPMRDHLRARLRVDDPPLERQRYSNLAFTLLAHLVEEITGEDFRSEVRRRILDPLEMTSTAFALSPEMVERMAIPYVPDPATGALRPTDPVRFAEWPAGGVWGTVLDQARWLAVNLNDGSFRGERILSPEMVELSQTPQFPRFQGSMAGGWGSGRATYGLTWWTTTRNRERYIAHSGSVRGYTAFLHGNRDRRVGVAILTNGNRAHSQLVQLSFLATDLMTRPAVDR